MGESKRHVNSKRRTSTTLKLWFTPGLHVKRWLVLLFSSVVLISLAVGYILRDVYSADVRFPKEVGYATLQFLPRVVRALLFATAGAALLILSFYKLGQSILGPFMLGRTSERGRHLSERPVVLEPAGYDR